MDDLEFVETHVLPLLLHVTAYLRSQTGDTRNKRNNTARMRQWTVDTCTILRSAYRRPLRAYEMTTLQALCDKLFAHLPRMWQRIGLPPTP